MFSQVTHSWDPTTPPMILMSSCFPQISPTPYSPALGQGSHSPQLITPVLTPLPQACIPLSLLCGPMTWSCTCPWNSGPRSEIQLLKKVQWLQLSFLTFGEGGGGYQRPPCKAVTWPKPPTTASVRATSPSVLVPEEALFICTLSKISRLICSVTHCLFSWLSVAFSEVLSKAKIQNDLWLFLQRSFHLHEISQAKPLAAWFRSL